MSDEAATHGTSQTAGARSAQGQARFFISYRHGDRDEERLAQDLRASIADSGQDVFIDESIPMGTDWVNEIGKRIKWADYLIVLLSEASITSEMVQAEVRLAARRRRQESKPVLLPIRVRFTGPLEYELESYLGRIEYGMWTSHQDTPRLLAEILDVVAKGSALPHRDSLPATAPAQSPDPLHPVPQVDPRTLTAPGGTVRGDDEHYVARPVDPITMDLADHAGTTLVIKAPRQMGKSSLLLRYLDASKQRGKHIGFIDMSVLSQDELASYPVFLSNLAVALLRAFGRDPSPGKQVKSQQDLTWMMEDTLLPSLDGPAVLALDEVDRLLGRPFQDDFFSMLRLWHNNRNSIHQARWENLALALVISTEPYLLIDQGDRSPFNVGTTVELLPFVDKEVAKLASAYRHSLNGGQLAELEELLGGHPYLLRLAFYCLVGPRRWSFDELIREAAEERGPFGEHLRALLFRLHTRRDLLNAFRQVILSGTIPSDDLYYRLYGAGLVRRTDRRAIPANLLYARFFKRVL